MELEKLKTGSDICDSVYHKLKNKIISGVLDTKQLCAIGNEILKTKLGAHQGCSIAIPVCISLNNCVGYYVHERDECLVIKDNDTVKIEFAVNVDGLIVVKGETFVINDAECGKDDTKIIDFLDDLSQQIVDEIKHGVTNDDIRMLIEAKCVENNCFPIENCISYQQQNGCLKGEESKYIVLNHTKYWDDDDNLVVEQDVCFDIEKEETYNIELIVCPTIDDSIAYKQKHSAHLYLFNEYYENLKTKSGRAFLSRVKKQYGNNAFCKWDVVSTASDKLGFKECYEKGLLDEFPILYTKPFVDVYHKKFTVHVLEKKCVSSLR